MTVTLFAPPPHGSILLVLRRPLASTSFPSRVPLDALSSNPRSIGLPLCSTHIQPPSPLQLEKEVGEEENVADVTFDPDAAETDSADSPRGCEACGREKIESGCNGEGRIQGGIATVPGFGWWPIKAYRPCPGFVESGGRYRRRGQSMDEVVSGRSGKAASAFASVASEKRQGPGRLKRRFLCCISFSFMHQ